MPRTFGERATLQVDQRTHVMVVGGGSTPSKPQQALPPPAGDSALVADMKQRLQELTTNGPRYRYPQTKDGRPIPAAPVFGRDADDALDRDTAQRRSDDWHEGQEGIGAGPSPHRIGGTQGYKMA